MFIRRSSCARQSAAPIKREFELSEQETSPAMGGEERGADKGKRHGRASNRESRPCGGGGGSGVGKCENRGGKWAVSAGLE